MKGAWTNRTTLIKMTYATDQKISVREFGLIGLACLWICLASLAPDVSLAGPFKVRPEDIVTVILAGLLLFPIMLSGRIRRTVIGLPFSVMLAGFAFGLIGLFAILVSIMSGMNLPSEGTFGHSLQLEILKEFVRFVKYAVVALAFANVPFRAWKPVLATLAFCCVVIVGIQILQYLGVSGLSEWVKETYKIDQLSNWSSRGAQNTGSWRSGSVMVQPNVMGAYLILPQLLFLMLFFQLYKSFSHEAKRYRFLWLCLSCIVFAGIFMTQSHTAMLAMLFGAMVGFLHIPRKVRKKLYRKILLIVIVVVVLGTIFGGSMSKFTPKQIVRNFTSSLGKKVHLTSAATEQLGLQIIVGAGASNGVFVDNEFGYIITWYGIAGLVVYYMFYGALYCFAIRRIKNIYVRAAFVGTIAAYVIGAIANSFLLCNRVFPVFIALLTLACAETISARQSKSVSDGSPLRENSKSVGLIGRKYDLPMSPNS